jgi:hypothetical protein
MMQIMEMEIIIMLESLERLQRKILLKMSKPTLKSPECQLIKI